MAEDKAKEEKPKKPTPGKEHLSSVRERLYDRSYAPRRNERTVLENLQKPEEAPHAWGAEPLRPMEPLAEDKEFQVSMRKKHNKQYRFYIILFGLLFFVVSLGLASVYMYMGGNTISNKNISVEIEGPSSVGGGEITALTVKINNGNTVPLHSASLLVTFPNGTLAPDGSGSDLLRETISLETIEPGEDLEIPLKAMLFGEEDQSLAVNAQMEYRLQGSNGTFEADAETHTIKINSSPVSVSIEGVTQISSGQPVELDMIVRSNSPAALKDVVVKAEYPFGFAFAESSQSTVSGQDTWVIDTLEPGEEKVITIKGIVTGLPSDVRIVSASVGIAGKGNSYDLESVFGSDDLEYEIEEKFVDLDVIVNGDMTETVIVNEGKTLNVVVNFTNPLESTLYDGEIVIELSGTAFKETGVEVQKGFYDSIKNVVIFDYNTYDRLASIKPGGSVNVSFSVAPDALVRETPEINLLTSVNARRVRESNVPESLIGSEAKTIKFASEAAVLASATYQSGEVPPVAEKLTQYTISLRVESGSSDLVDPVVTATLPIYVSWLDLSSGDGSVTFNSSSRTITWEAGDIPDNSSATASFTVGLLPSISQVGDSPVLVSAPSLKATDRFTNTIVRGQGKSVNTVLSAEAGYSKNDGIVVRTKSN